MEDINTEAAAYIARLVAARGTTRASLALCSRRLMAHAWRSTKAVKAACSAELPALRIEWSAAA